MSSFQTAAEGQNQQTNSRNQNVYLLLLQPCNCGCGDLNREDPFRGMWSTLGISPGLFGSEQRGNTDTHGSRDSTATFRAEGNNLRVFEHSVLVSWECALSTLHQWETEALSV